MKDILVTGGTGFIGRHLIPRLVREGYRVRCLVRETSEVTELKHLGVELIYGDIRDGEWLKKAVRKVDTVFHLAGEVSVSRSLGEPWNAFHINTVGTLNLLEAIRSIGGTNCLVIHMSSDRVYGNPEKEWVNESEMTNPLEPYVASKMCAELLCQTYSTSYNIPFVIIRGGNVYGPGQRGDFLIPSIIEQILLGKDTIAVGNVNSYRNFVYVQDIIEALFLTLHYTQSRNQIFNIAERNASVKEVIETLSKLCYTYLGRNIQIIQDPSLMRPPGLESKRYQLDCTKAKEVLGWHPKYPLEKGLEETFKSALQG